MIQFDDEYFMRMAYQQAQIAMQAGEVPVGAVIVYENQVIAKAHNQAVLLKDATAHAEMLAITSAFAQVGSRYLNECTLYVTLEPCIMCAGACYWSMLKRVVYGASDIKFGFQRISPKLLHPSTQMTIGVMEEDCRLLIQDFFKKLRR